MSITITPRGKHEDLSWVAAGAVTMENMVYNSGELQLKWRMFLCCYSLAYILRAGGLNLSLNKYPSNFKFHVVTHVYKSRAC